MLWRSAARLSTAQPRSSEPPVRARVVEISKSFGKTIALDHVSLEFRAGEVHAILGENGAGKTTLVRILSGIQTPDMGSVEIDGNRIALRARNDGARHGIGIVQQQDGLVQELTGIDNYLLDSPDHNLWLNRARAGAELMRAAETLGLTIRPNVLVSGLSMGERQRLEIVIALMIGASIIIFDEPTAALLTNEVRVLIQVIRKLVEQGRSVVYITHKLDEVMEIADRVTVLRRGRAIGHFSRAELDKTELITAMVGRVPERAAAGSSDVGEIVAALKDVSVMSSRDRCGLRTVSLTVRRREIVGIAGVAGNGQETLAEVMRGLLMPSAGVFQRVSELIAFIPEDRARDGLAMGLSIADNLMVYRHRDPRFRSNGRLSGRAVSGFVQATVERTGVVLQSISASAASLSGGNQQKLVIAREFERQPDLIIAHNPYRGLDVAATAAVRGLLLAARDAGAAVVLISPDLDDLFDIANHIMFLSNGRLSESIDPRSATLHALGTLLGGGWS